MSSTEQAIFDIIAKTCSIERSRITLDSTLKDLDVHSLDAVQVLFEIEDEVRRAATLARLGGVEDRLFIQVGDARIHARPEGDVERTREDGKTSAVHFLHFDLKPEHIAVFRNPTTTIMVGCDHESYAHMAVLSPATRAELARDFG